MGNIFSNLWKGITKAFKNVGNYVLKSVKAIIKDPLPTLLSYAGAMVGIPPYVTSAAITAARGGDLGDIAKSAAVSYVSSKLLTSTDIGKTITGKTTSLGNDFTSSLNKNFGLPLDTAINVAKATTVGLNSSIVGGINAAITGKDILQGMTSGFTSGVIYSSSDSYFDSVNKNHNWGLSEKTLDFMKGAASTAAQSVVNGDKDLAGAVGNYVAYATMNMAESKLEKYAKETWNDLTAKTEKVKQEEENYKKLKERFDKKVDAYSSVEDERQENIDKYNEIINGGSNGNDLSKKYDYYGREIKKLSSSYESAVADYNKAAEKYKVLAKQPAAVNGGATRNARNVMDGFYNKANSIASKITDLQEDFKDSDVNTELTNLRNNIKKSDDALLSLSTEFDSQEFKDLTTKLTEASNVYENSYNDWSNSKSTYDKASQSYNNAVRDAATRDATIDAVNSGVIKVNSKDADGNYVLSNGMILTQDGKFMQDGAQVFTGADGVKQKELSFTSSDGTKVSLDEDLGLLVPARHPDFGKQIGQPTAEISGGLTYPKGNSNSVVTDAQLPSVGTFVPVGKDDSSLPAVPVTALSYEEEQRVLNANPDLKERANETAGDLEVDEKTGEYKRTFTVKNPDGTSYQHTVYFDPATKETTYTQDVKDNFEVNEDGSIGTGDIRILKSRANSEMFGDNQDGSILSSQAQKDLNRQLLDNAGFDQFGVKKKTDAATTGTSATAPTTGSNTAPATNPVTPTTPTTPTTPVAPANPVNPVTPTTPTGGSGGAENIAPTNPTGGSGTVTTPTTPTGGGGAVNPTAPTGGNAGSGGVNIGVDNPTIPVGTGAETGTGTGTPTNPVAPVTPVTPVAPVIPVAPVTPVTPPAEEKTLPEVEVIGEREPEELPKEPEKEPEKEKEDPIITKSVTPPSEPEKQPTRSGGGMDLSALLGTGTIPAVVNTWNPHMDIGLKTSGEAKFQSPLEKYLNMVNKNYAPEAPPPEQAAQITQPAQQQSSYFNYGQPTDIDQLIAGDLYEQPFQSGGLATPLFAGGGNTRYGRYAGGGLNIVEHSGKARIDFRSGDAVTGAGDGQSDDIPAMLADGEFVFPADVVSALGNGSTKAGSDKLYDMMHSIRSYHRAAKPKDLPPPAKKSPLDYLKSRK